MTQPHARVLVVDDNDAGRYVLTRTLKVAGYDVREAASGRTALDAMTEGPDLVVLDVNLPDLSGIDVARHLRADPDLAGTPVLMVSAARLTDGDRAHGLEGGADAYLTHPIDPAVLLATVRSLLRVRRAEWELRQLNRELEAQVARRTADLQAKTEELARQNARLEEANNDLEAFAYSVSHDLRAPLRHISGFSTLLRRRVTHVNDPQSLRYLEMLERSAHTMDALIEALLVYSRLGRRGLEYANVNLAELVRDVRAELEPDIGTREISWTLEALPTVRGDPHLLKLVLANLLANAVKFTRHVNPARIHVTAAERADAWVITVRDNGVGFDARYQHKLFGVFQRLHRQEEFEGTGLGLANVKRMIQRHGGQVHAEGEVGAGAAFSFTLPKGHGA